MKRALRKRLTKKLREERAEAVAKASAKVLDRKTIADNIKATVGRYYRGKNRAVLPELGLCKGGRLRADLFVLGMNGYSVVVEVKSSVADYRSDKKHLQYLDYGHQCYFAVTHKVWKKIKDDISPEFGTFILTDDGLYIKKVLKAKRREISKNIIFNLGMRAVFRTMPSSDRKNKAL